MKEKLIKILAVAIALMGIIHIIATFTPLISGGLEVLTQAKQNALTYMSLMCGLLLIVCGLLVYMLHNKIKDFSPLHNPFMIILIALAINGITAVAFMPHNPFAWIIFALTTLLEILCL